MKVILLKNVPKIGARFEVKDVSAGHATNFLIPKGLAEIATESSIKRIETVKAQADAERKIHEDLLMKNLVDMQGVVIEMEESANEQGHLFAGIHKEEIIPEIKKQTQLEILPEYINLEKPIKEVGEHEIEVKVQDKVAKFKLIVKAK
jgi:large subunit ribosomal protein L9